MRSGVIHFSVGAGCAVRILARRAAGVSAVQGSSEVGPGNTVLASIESGLDAPKLPVITTDSPEIKRRDLDAWRSAIRPENEFIKQTRIESMRPCSRTLLVANQI